MAPTLNDLDDDVLRCIFDHLELLDQPLPNQKDRYDIYQGDSKESLLSLSKVNRRMRSLVEPGIYRRMRICGGTEFEPVADMLDKLQKRPVQLYTR